MQLDYETGSDDGNPVFLVSVKYIVMWNRIVLKYGIWFFTGLMVYYFLMQFLGLSTRYDFRIFNGVIQIVVVYLAIRTYASTKPQEFNYLTGTLIGINTSVVGVVPFAIFQMINLYLNTPLLEYIQQNAPVVGPYVNPFSGGLIVFMEGLAVGLIFSYICMRVVDLQLNASEKLEQPGTRLES
jgi:hypothetical protein